MSDDLFEAAMKAYDDNQPHTAGISAVIDAVQRGLPTMMWTCNECGRHNVKLMATSVRAMLDAESRELAAQFKIDELERKNAFCQVCGDQVCPNCHPGSTLYTANEKLAAALTEIANRGCEIVKMMGGTACTGENPRGYKCPPCVARAVFDV